MLARTLDSSKVMELKETFEQLDEDQNGLINADQLKSFFFKSSITLEDYEAEKILDTIDRRNHTTLRYTDFIASTLDIKSLVEEDEH